MDELIKYIAALSAAVAFMASAYYFPAETFLTFTIGWLFIIPIDKEGMFEVNNEKNLRLSQVVSEEKTKFIYIYDFEDYWQHKILIEKILPQEPDMQYPICIKMWFPGHFLRHIFCGPLAAMGTQGRADRQILI